MNFHKYKKNKASWKIGTPLPQIGYIIRRGNRNGLITGNANENEEIELLIHHIRRNEKY